MTKMEIATYLGMANVIFTQGSDKTCNDEFDTITPIRTALCEAQMIMYELARQEIIEERSEK